MSSGSGEAVRPPFSDFLLERFTGAARATVLAADGEARQLGHDHIGAEHLLLALLAEPDTEAGVALAAFGVTRDSVLSAIPPGVSINHDARIEPRPNVECKTVVEQGLRQALNCGLPRITTDCLLLSMLADRRNIGARILSEHGMRMEDVVRRLGYRPRSANPNAELSDDVTALTKENAWLHAAVAEMRPVFDRAVRTAESGTTPQGEWARAVTGRIAAGEFGEPRHLL